MSRTKTDTQTGTAAPAQLSAASSAARLPRYQGGTVAESNTLHQGHATNAVRAAALTIRVSLRPVHDLPDHPQGSAVQHRSTRHRNPATIATLSMMSQSQQSMLQLERTTQDEAHRQHGHHFRSPTHRQHERTHIRAPKHNMRHSHAVCLSAYHTSMTSRTAAITA